MVKIQIVKRYLSGEGSYYTLVKEINVHHSVVERWVKKYKPLGENAFDLINSNNSYIKEFKETVVLAYINGEG